MSTDGIAMSVFYQNRSDVMYFYVSENNTYPPHLHNQVELLFVLEGALTLTVGEHSYTLLPQAGGIIFPNQLHSLRTEGTSKMLLCIFRSSYCHSFQKYFKGYRPCTNFFSSESLSAHSRTGIDGLLGLTDSFTNGSPIPIQVLNVAEGYLTLLLADIFRTLPLEELQSYEDLELEQRLLVYLDMHFMDNLSLEALSKEFGISRFRLSRIFSDRLHTSFPYYVNSKRLEYARELLESTPDSVTQIALDAGFGSSRTFFREFRQAYHTTPGAYRRSHTPLR